MADLSIELNGTGKEAISTIQTINVDLSTLEKTLKNVEDVLTNMYLEMGKMENASSKANNQIKNIANTTKEVAKSTKDLKNNLGGLSVIGIVNSFRGLGRQIMSLSSTSIDASEQLNLFNRVFKNMTENGETTFSVLGEKAMRFQNQLHEAFNTNIVETMKMQAMYQSLGENIGIKDIYAEIMSENMTKMTYDLASLYNKSEEQVQTAIQSGVYAGQTRPMRQFGVDLTMQNLQVTLDRLGIDRAISDLSQAEKEVVRYITVLNQADIAMGDFADTIDSPANQIKMLKQQFTELKIAIGNLFVNAFAKIAPYVNAIIMVAKELLKTLASLFGIELKDYGSGSQQNYADYLDGVGDSADGASKKVKELKRQTLGFDQINNITSPSSSGSKGASGAGGIGAIDKKLLDAIKEYDNGMDSVRNKARDIRDKIMEWLGFTKEINPETGEITWKYQGLGTTLKNMWSSFKELSVQGKILAGIIGVIITTSVITMFKKFLGLLDKSGLLGVLKLVYSPLTNFVGKLKEMFITVDEEGNKNFTKLGEKVSNFGTKVKEGAVLVGNLVTGLVGMKVAENAFKNINTDGANFGNILEGIIGLLTVFSGSLGAVQAVVSLFNTTISTGMLGGISLAITAVVGLISWLNGSADASREVITENQKLIESYNDVLESANKTFSNKNATLEYSKKLTEELGKYIDANGKVKKSDEDRVNFILNYLNDALGTNYKLVGDQIEQNGKVIKGQQDLQNEIKKQIILKKQEILLNAYEEDYANAIKESIKGEQEKRYWQTLINQAELDYHTALELGDTKKANSLAKDIQMYKDKLTEAEGYYGQFDEKIRAYENLYEDSLKGNAEKTNYYVGKLATDYANRTEFEVKRTVDNTNTYIDNKLNNKNTKINVDADMTYFNQKTNNVNLGTKTVKVNADTNNLNGQVSSIFDKKIYTAKVNFKSVTPNQITIDTKNNVERINFKANGGLFKNGSWKPITQYASGGLPSTGQMFIAREAGPELVGRIGSNTAVMNNNQIVSSVASGVAQAVASVMGSGSDNVELYVHTDEGTVIDRINRRKRQTGVCPIEI